MTCWFGGSSKGRTLGLGPSNLGSIPSPPVMHYDKQGRPIDFETWALLRRSNKYYRVGLDTVEDTTISTVWLGMDHGFGEHHEPVIFETLIMGGPLDQEMWRYTSHPEAIAGHHKAVELVRLEYAVRQT